MNNELYHHGVLGQKWGIRRYQNPDGTLTDAGRKRYQEGSLARNYQNRLNDLDTAMSRHKRDSVKALNRYDELTKRKTRSLSDRFKASMKDPIWVYSPITKSGITKATDKEWAKLQNAAKMVDAGKAETNEIMRKMIKNNMYVSSAPVSRASVKGEKYCLTVLQNAPESSEYRMSRNQATGQYKLEVMGNKYKVSDHKKIGYKHPSEL